MATIKQSDLPKLVAETKGRRAYNQREAAEQTALFEWAEINLGKYPELASMFHIPNGGSRNMIEAVHLKRQGVKSGVPDIFLPVAFSGYSGLFIELKVGKNKPSENQLAWQKTLTRNGYLSAICYGWTEAANLIEKYLNGNG